MNRLRGILWGMLSGASFGLIPLFTLPLLASGLTTDSVLFYRFAVAAVVICILLLLQGENLKITAKQAVRLIALGALYMASALFLLLGYDYMPAGIATAVHFMYPVCVVVLMTIFFGERASLTNFAAIVMAVVGVTILSSNSSTAGGDPINIKGIIMVIISSLSYALYIIGIKKMNLGNLSGFKLTFYVMAITALIFLFKAMAFGDGIAVVKDAPSIIHIVLLAVIPTVVSNFALVKAINIVGSTTASILGALEPMTAVVVGITVFNEPLNALLLLGILLIIGAVTTIVLKKPQKIIVMDDEVGGDDFGSQD